MGWDGLGPYGWLSAKHDRCMCSVLQVKWVVEHQWFEKGVILLIIANAIFLMFDTPWTDADCISSSCDAWSLTMYIANLFFVIVFTIELILQLIAYGITEFCLGPKQDRWSFSTFPWANWVCVPDVCMWVPGKEGGG